MKNLVEMIKEKVMFETEDFMWRAVACQLLIMAILPIMIQ